MKNYLTFRELDYGCLQAIGKADADIDAVIRKQYINDSLMKIYAMLDGLADPFYNMTSLLTIASDIELQADTHQINEGERLHDIVSYSHTDLTGPLNIARSSGTFQAGSLLCITVCRSVNVGDDDYPPGAAKIKHSCVARVIESGSDVTAEIIAGTIETWTLPAPPCISVIIIKSLSALTADISGLYVKEIDAIYDDLDRGNQKVFDQYVDIDKFRDLPRIPSKQTRVGYIQRGDTIVFQVGEDALPIGVPTMEYRGKPTVYTDDTEDSTIMIPPEYNQIINDEVTAKFLEHLGEKPKVDLAARLTGNAKMFEAAEANKQKAIERKNK